MHSGNRRHQIIQKDVYPILKLAMPLALTGMLQSSVFFFETLFLAHVSQDALAAGALVSWLFCTLVAILYGILSSINILIAHKYGANDRIGISLVVRDGIFLAILLAVPVCLLVWNMAPIFLIFGQSPAIVLLAKSYLHALAWGVLPDFVMIAFLEFIMGLGHARIIMMFTILSVSLNVFLSFILIFGMFGMPVLGIAGAGWGMTISYWITVVVLGIYILTNKAYSGYLQNILTMSKQAYLLELLQVGLPMGLMYCVEVAFLFVLVLLMGSFGVHMLAANQIVMQYSSLLIGIVFSISQAITVRMSHLLGAKAIHSAERAYYVGLLIVSALIGISAIFYWFFPTVLIAIDFNIEDPNNLKIVHYAKQFFSIAAVFMILESIRISLFGALRGLRDTHFPLVISVVSFWCIALPIGYLLATSFQLEGAGFLWGMVIGSGFGAGLLFFRFKSKIRRYKLYELVSD